MSSANTSTTSLVSTTTVSSRAPLTGSAQKKDFQTAFASLQSTYGFAASAPTPVLKKKSTSSTTLPTVRASSSTATTKDFQSAFADLQSTYGFGGSAPMPVPKKQGVNTTSNKLFSKFTRSSSSAAK
ncbi:hypothetical protein C8F04DRAFT_1097616 [Mycena alexandri]|uniref:Uncharacterized protein n=1 Tax=Mycena alexandri TaxID=1745969 RepID=A0AAD6SYS6_9AGAR|nr:hypothetical protein C8F04DRAFT_1097616 [Mycena alexandri]